MLSKQEKQDIASSDPLVLISCLWIFEIRQISRRFVCKTLYLCGTLVVFCPYLEYNAITPFCSHVLYRFLHTYFFSCAEVLSM